MVDDISLGKRIRENVMMIDVFLAQEHASGRLQCTFTSPLEKVLIHGHCHQKALFGTASMKDLLTTVPSLSLNEVDSVSFSRRRL